MKNSYNNIEVNKMSKKNYLIFLVALLALTGCKKNNNANNSSSNSTISDSSSSSIDEGDGSYEPYNVVFNMNASSTTVVPSYDYSGIYLEGESTAYIEEFLLNPFRYEVNDRTNTLTIHIPLNLNQFVFHLLLQFFLPDLLQFLHNLVFFLSHPSFFLILLQLLQLRF